MGGAVSPAILADRFLVWDKRATLRRLDVPAVAVVATEPLIGLFMIGDLQLAGVPGQLRLAVADGDVAQQDRLGKGSAVIETVARLNAADTAVDPAVVVILAVDFLDLGVGVDAECADVRQDDAALLADKQRTAARQPLALGQMRL